MAPKRIAIIGLSQAAKTSWASQAHIPYLLSDRGRSRYQIVALLNSSVAAAKRAIEAYKLPSDTKAYGSPQDLAADGNVDLVVCTTRVDVHYDSAKPSIEAGKTVYVEWPLAENVARAKELADLAKTNGAATLVGLQARVAPSILKLKEVLMNGAIGKVVSSDVQAFTPGGGGDSISEGLGYFLDKKVGGNPVTIANAHMTEYIHFVLGEFESSHSHLQIQRPKQQIVNRDTGASRAVMSDVPDLASTHGTLQSSALVAEGASLIINFKSGPPFPGTTPFTWIITGEKGRIRISCQRGPFINSEGSDWPIPIEIEDFSTGEVREIEWRWDEWQQSLSGRCRNIAKLYDLYYEGRTKEFGVSDFEDAAERHAEIDGMLY